MAETKRTAKKAAQRAVAVALSAVMVVAYGVPAEALADAAGAGEATDIAAEWSDGAMTISEGGRYMLSEDVETDGTLTVLAGEGETVELDLAGHSVEVEGEVFAGIDASGSLGSVVVCDSEYDQDAGEDGKASVSVASTVSEGDVAAVLADYELPDGEDGEGLESPSLELEGVSLAAGAVASEGDRAVSGVEVGYADGDDPRGELDVSLVDVSVSAEAASGGELSARGVWTSAAGVAVVGSFSSVTPSDDSGCDLYSDVEGAFELAEGFDPGETLSLFSVGNEPGSVFAGVAEELADVEGLTSVFEDATGSGAVLELSEGELVFAEASDEEGEASGAGEAGDGDASSALSELAERAEAADDGDGASGPAEAIGFLLEALSGDGEDGEDEGSSLSPLSDGSTWTVTDSSGSTVGSYDSFDDAESALDDGGTVSLEQDASGVEAEFDGKSSGSYTIDLNGHVLGAVEHSCEADLTVTSSTDGGTIDGSAAKYGVYGNESGDLTVQNISVTSTGVDQQGYFWGVRGYKMGDITVRNVSVTSSSPGTTTTSTGAYGFYFSTVDSFEVEDCDVSATVTSSSSTSYSYALYLSSSSGTIEDSSFSAESAGSQSAYGANVGTSSTAEVTNSSFSATSASGTAYGAYVKKTLTAEGSSFSASSEGGSGYALCSGTSGSISLGSGCTFSGSAADFYLSTAMTLLSGFSTSTVLSVYNKTSITGAVFANLADGLDGDALADMFESTSGSYYAGYHATASGSSLIWSSDAEAVSADLYDVLVEDGKALQEDVTLDVGVEYYLSQSVTGYSGNIQMTGDGVYDIDLRGNTITFSSGGFYLYPSSGGTGTLNLYSTDGNGNATQAKVVEGYVYSNQKSGTPALSMKNIDMTMSANTITAYAGAMPVTAKGITSSLVIEDCNIDVDYSGKGGSDYSAVIGVRIDSESMSTCSITGTTIDVKSDSPYDAVAVYMSTKSCKATVEDCTISAESTQGTATAFYNDKYYSDVNADITFSGTTELAATGASGCASFGILNIQGKFGNISRITETPGCAVTLDGEVSFSSESSSYVAALASEVQYTDSSTAPFELGPSFSAESGSLSVAVGVNDDDSFSSANNFNGGIYSYSRPFILSGIAETANEAGSYIAAFGDGVGSDSYEAMTAAFSNANSLMATEPGLADDGVLFQSINFTSVAHIERGGETLEYETLALATADAADGETVYLDADLSEIATISESSSAETGTISYTLDLNGHDVEELSCETSQDVTVVDSSEESSSKVIGYAESGTNGGTYGVVQESEGTLTLQGVEVEIQNASTLNTYGVRADSGKIVLEECSVSVDANSSGVRAVYLGGGSVKAADTEIVAKTADTSSTVSVAAVGVYVTRSSSSAELDGCTVTASGAPGEVSGAYVPNGSFSASATSLSANATGSTGSAYGVYASPSTAEALDGCSLAAAVADGSSGSAWCVYADMSSGGTGAEVSLSGETSFESSEGTHVYHAATALQVSDDFEPEADGDAVAVQSASLADGDVFAEPADEGGDLSGLKDSFEAAETSDNAYMGWDVEANDDGSLSWTNDPVAELSSEGLLGETVTEYMSLSSALSDASEGDTVTMIADSTESALSVACGVTVDLNGHDVSVRSSGSYGITVSSGRLTLVDSSEEGSGLLSVVMLAESSYTQASTNVYTLPDASLAMNSAGMYVSSKAGLTLDGCDVEVTASSSSTRRAVTGAYAASGSSVDGEAAVLLTGGSKLSVDAGSAMKSYGVFVGSGYTEGVPSIQVDDGASVSVTNDNDFLEQSYSNPTFGSTLDNEVWLSELDIDPASDLWAEICEVFLYKAEYDSSSGVYGISNETLSDGTVVWAYSDEVAEENVGVEDYIVPSIVYEMSDCDISPDAVGVGDNGASGATIQIEGAVEAISQNGNAYALRTYVSSTWEVDGAELSATSYGTEDYLKISQYKSEGWVSSLAGDNSYRYIEKTEPEASCISRGEVSSTRYNNGETEQATVEISGDVSMDSSSMGGFDSDVMLDEVSIASDFAAGEGEVTLSDDEGETSWGDVFAVSSDGETEVTSDQAEAFEDANGDFEPGLTDDSLGVTWDYATAAAHATVTFTGAKDSEGSNLSDVEVTTDIGVSFGEENAALAPDAQDYGKYRFIGWEVTTSSDEAYGSVIDPECLFSYEFDSDVTLTASYVYVNESSQLVVFKVDDLLYAGAVTGGSAVTWRQVSGSSSSPARTSSGTWEFLGWHEGDDYDGDYLALTSDDVDYGPSADLPFAVAGGEDVWYTAVFEGDATAVSQVTLYYYSDWDGSGDWTYGSGSFSLADGTDVSSDESVTSGEYLVSGVAVDCVTKNEDGTWEAHEFLGWSTRQSDVAPLSKLPAVGEGVSAYYAIYDSHDMDVEATFVGDGESCTVTVGSSASVREAVSSDGYSLEAPAGMQLAGWAYEEGATSTAFTNDNYVYMWSSLNFSAPENGSGDIVGSAVFYAVWETADPVDMVLHLNGGMWSESSSDDLEDEVTPGIAIEWESYSNPYKYGCYFEEWNDAEDGSGDEFDVTSDPVPDDGLELWAQYGDITEGEVADGAELGLSESLVRTRAAVGADAVEVSLEEASAADGDLSVSSTYYEELADYRLSVCIVYDQGTTYESSSELTEGFGTLYVSMPVDDAYADRDLYAFTLEPDGTTTKTACAVETSLSDGTTLAVFSLTSYGSSAYGNVVLAYALTSSEITLNAAKATAKEQLNDLYATYSSDDYTGDESTGTWGELCTYYEDGLAAIEAATSVSGVSDAYETAANGMAGVETTAGLAQAQAEALERLAEAYASYSSDDYSSKNWKKLVAAYESAKAAIQSAETSSGAASAASAGIIAMARVKTSSSSGSSLSSSSSSGSSLSSSSGSKLSSSSSLSTSSSLSSSTSLTGSSGSSLSSSSTSGSSGRLTTSSSKAGSMLDGELLTVDKTVADAFALKAKSGVVVLTVDEGGALDQATVRVGDVIVAVDGKEISTLDELEEYLSGKSAGDEVTFTVNRGGELLELSVTLSEDGDSGLSEASDEADGSGDGSGDGSDGSGGPLKWMGSHLYIVIPVFLLILFLIGLLIGLLLRRRKKDDDEDEEEPESSDGSDDDGFWGEEEE